MTRPYLIAPSLAYVYFRDYMRVRMVYWALGSIRRAWDVDTTGKDQQ